MSSPSYAGWTINDFLAAPLDHEDGSPNIRNRMVKIITDCQDAICAGVEKVDGKAKFHEDSWDRPNGGGGRTRVISGKVIEKAGVNVSVVFGELPPAAVTAMKSNHDALRDFMKEKEGKVPFFACGLSLIIHPKNPFAPTAHANIRLFTIGDETEPQCWWFGGGTDLTPHYLFEEDAIHFHQTLKDVCDKSDKEYYPKFKKWCDDYFYNKHREEHRGIGGIFFDDLTSENPLDILNFVAGIGECFSDAYLPIVEKRKGTPYTEENRFWQELRHGRYVEFNLVYDRGTQFGLRTPGSRIESILVSLPSTVRFEYCHEPEEGSEEAKALAVLRTPKDWL